MDLILPKYYVEASDEDVEYFFGFGFKDFQGKLKDPWAWVDLVFDIGCCFVCPPVGIALIIFDFIYG